MTTNELKWLKQLLIDLGFTYSKGIQLYYDSESTLHISQNLVFSEKTKHIEVDCHFVHNKVITDIICPSHVPTKV